MFKRALQRLKGRRVKRDVKWPPQSAGPKGREDYEAPRHQQLGSGRDANIT